MTEGPDHATVYIRPRSDDAYVKRLPMLFAVHPSHTERAPPTLEA